MADSPDPSDTTSSEPQSEKEVDNVSVETASLSNVADSPNKSNKQNKSKLHSSKPI